MDPVLAIAFPIEGLPDNSLPGMGGRPDNSLPGGRPDRPNQGLPVNPPVGVWPPRPRPWPPVPPIFVPPDDDVGISLPIYLPGTPDNGLPPVEVQPGRPANPIVLPPPPDVGALLALVIPLPSPEPKGDAPAGTKPALLWYGPGTIPQLVYLGTPATPK